MTGFGLAAAAVAAGFVSAASPCVLPVIPGYLAAVSGAVDAQSNRPRVSVRRAGGFVGGFTIVFVLLGATASALGAALYDHLTLLLRVAGVALIVLGLHSLGLFPIGALDRERRLQPTLRGTGPARAVGLGAVFALGWTPCIGPILATVLTKAASTGSVGEGMWLLMLYSAGLGIPFVVIAAQFERSTTARRWLTHHGRAIQRVGAVAMLFVGLAYVTGAWSTIFSGLQTWLARHGWPPF